MVWKMVNLPTTDLKEMEVQYITSPAGERVAVVLPLDAFNALLEDLDDLAIAAERRDEPAISHFQLLEELKADGLLHD